MKRNYNVGGQAVLEGVMIKCGNRYATAVRLDSGKIKVKKNKIRFGGTKIPFIRGILNLILMLYLGVKTLNWSASQALGEKESSTLVNIITILISLGFAILLFKFIPLVIASSINTENSFLFNVADGVVKIGILILYLFLISRLKDIQRVFEYHGAEHKTVNCYEAKEILNVNNCKKFSRIHKRCGTTFIFLVLFISIFVYLFIPMNTSFIWKFGLRILLLPLIASICYELIFLSSKSKNEKVFNVIMFPGLLIQRLSTKEPSKKQLEVAICALKNAIGGRDGRIKSRS